MKTFGITATQKLTSLIEVTLPGLETFGYYPEQLCPPLRFWETHPDAPWNVVIERDPELWREQYPDRWGNAANDDPSAPWNQPEPSRNPADYTDDHGDPILWTAPEVVPLVKLDKPTTFNPATHDCEPTLVWFANRVERDWQVVQLSQEEARLAARIALRTTWESLPAWIRGPFGDKFDAAYRMVIAGDYDAATALIEYAEMPSAYSIEQAAIFAQAQAQMASGIAALAQI